LPLRPSAPIAGAHFGLFRPGVSCAKWAVESASSFVHDFAWRAELPERFESHSDKLHGQALWHDARPAVLTRSRYLFREPNARAAAPLSQYVGHHYVLEN